MTSFAIWTELLPVELPAILGLILVVLSLLLLVDVQLVILAELIESMCKLTLSAVSAHTVVPPILAKLTLIHRSLDKTLLGFVQGNFFARTVDFLTDYRRLWSFDDRRDHACLTKRYKASRLLNFHCMEWIQLRWRILLLMRSNEVAGTGWEGKAGASFIDNCRSSITQAVVSLAGHEATVINLEATVYHHFLRTQCRQSVLGHEISNGLVSLCLIESRWDGAQILWSCLISHRLEFKLLALPLCRVKSSVLLRIRGSEGRRRRLHWSCFSYVAK